MSHVFKQKLTEQYSALSAKLKEAADFVNAKPIDVATRSLRSISADAGVAPVTFTRLARALGYESYEVLREEMRSAVSQKPSILSESLIKLRNTHSKHDSAFLSEHVAASIDNLGSLGQSLDPNEMTRVADQLRVSRKVLVSGALGSTGVAEYMTYMANFITDKWYLAGRGGASFGGAIVNMDSNDTLIVITKPPFANKTFQLAEIASSQGVFVVVITDTYKCPALIHASASFIVPTNGANFFSSYAATVVLVEGLVGMLAADADNTVLDRMAKVEQTNRKFEYLAED